MSWHWHHVGLVWSLKRQDGSHQDKNNIKMWIDQDQDDAQSVPLAELRLLLINLGVSTKIKMVHLAGLTFQIPQRHDNKAITESWNKINETSLILIIRDMPLWFPQTLFLYLSRKNYYPNTTTFVHPFPFLAHKKRLVESFARQNKSACLYNICSII